MSLSTLVWVAGGGAIGAVLRFAATLACARALGLGFPYGTFLVNMVGSFAIGLLAGLLGDRPAAFERAFLLTGVLGGFTTFSTFSLETQALIVQGRHGAAAANAFGQLALGVTFAALGLWLARRLG